MLRRALAFATGLVLLAGSAAAASCDMPADAAGMRAAVADLVAVQRKANGRSALARNARLDTAAQDHACWMSSTGKYGHKGANGSMPKGRVKAAGYRACLTAENVAWGQASAGQVVAEWMASKGHKANILNGSAREVGVGVSLLDGRPAWVLVFARPC